MARPGENAPISSVTQNERQSAYTSSAAFFCDRDASDRSLCLVLIEAAADSPHEAKVLERVEQNLAQKEVELGQARRVGDRQLRTRKLLEHETQPIDRLLDA